MPAALSLILSLSPSLCLPLTGWRRVCLLCLSLIAQGCAQDNSCRNAARNANWFRAPLKSLMLKTQLYPLLQTYSWSWQPLRLARPLTLNLCISNELHCLAERKHYTHRHTGTQTHTHTHINTEMRSRCETSLRRLWKPVTVLGAGLAELRFKASLSLPSFPYPHPVPRAANSLKRWKLCFDFPYTIAGETPNEARQIA